MSDQREPFESPLKIPYRKLPLSGKTLWPITEIKFPNIAQPILALVDSGASFSVLHEDIANLIGLKKENETEQIANTAAGDFQYWKSLPTSVQTCGMVFDFSFAIPIESHDLIWPCILGHDSIFRMAKIEFVTFKGYFTFSFRTDLN